MREKIKSETASFPLNYFKALFSFIIPQFFYYECYEYKIETQLRHTLSPISGVASIQPRLDKLSKKQATVFT